MFKPPTARDRILRSLSTHGPSRVRDITARVGCTDSAVYLYLREFRENGLVKQNGRYGTYQLTELGAQAAEQAEIPKLYSRSHYLYRIAGSVQAADEHLAARAVELYERGESSNVIAREVDADDAKIWALLIQSGVAMRENGLQRISDSLALIERLSSGTATAEDRCRTVTVAKVEEMLIHRARTIEDMSAFRAVAESLLDSLVEAAIHGAPIASTWLHNHITRLVRQNWVARMSIEPIGKVGEVARDVLGALFHALPSDRSQRQLFLKRVLLANHEGYRQVPRRSAATQSTLPPATLTELALAVRTGLTDTLMCLLAIRLTYYDRNIITLRVVYGQSIAEVAKILNKAPHHISAAQSRALAKLRDHFDRTHQEIGRHACEYQSTVTVISFPSRPDS
jgi:predicted ArsR family transcriptional regulator/DNA-directed RNA polymerase specialized sigma24 family protein